MLYLAYLQLIRPLAGIKKSAQKRSLRSRFLFPAVCLGSVTLNPAYNNKIQLCQYPTIYVSKMQ